MKAVILCGGLGTRIRDVSEVLPKPMLPIGNKPILWHIMKIYAAHGVRDFVLCLGYKGWIIKEFFLNYHAMTSDVTITLDKKESVVFHDNHSIEDWRVTLVHTGEDAATGARIWRARRYLEDCEYFSVTYGDGLADINVSDLVREHKSSDLMATITGVRPTGRFGEIELKGKKITELNEKPNVSRGLINGGFMMFKREVIYKYFDDQCDLILENDVLGRLVKDGQLGVYKHFGYWQCVDTLREYNQLNELWTAEKAPWKV